MKAKVTDVAKMLDDLELPLAAARLRKIQDGPELSNFSSVQLLSSNKMTAHDQEGVV